MTAPNAAAAPVNCPSCGRPLPPDAPSGQCPACLLRAGFPTPGGAAPVPDLGAVRAALPQFDVLELLGQGGMGVVWRARQRALDRTVALKVLPRGAGAEHDFAERFAREAKALARLQHPGIVQVHEFGETPDFFWLAMEFVDGITLRAAMRERRLSPREALAIVPQICDALQYAHDQGVVHRDVKPENVLLDRRGRVKIADFGLAKLLGRAGDPTLTRPGHVMGTPHYMAPEQVEHPADVDHRADIYSLGVVFYEMLTGELPLGRFAAPSRKVEMDVRLDEIVLRALEKEPERRWQHASEVRTHVTEVAAGPAAPVRPIVPEAQAPLAPGETPKLLRLAVAGCAVVVFSCIAMAGALAADGVAIPALLFSGLAVLTGWIACLVSAIRIHHAKGRLRGAAFAWVGLLLPLVGSCLVPAAWVLVTDTRSIDFSHGPNVTAPASQVPPDANEVGTRTDLGVTPPIVISAKGDFVIRTGEVGMHERILRVWDELRANHASLDVDGALRFYVPDNAEWIRTQIPKRDVRDGSCGLPLADEKALRGRLSTLVLRKIELDDSGHFATVEGSDGVRTVKAEMCYWRERPSRTGVADPDPEAFRWSFTAEPIEVR